MGNKSAMQELLEHLNKLPKQNESAINVIERYGLLEKERQQIENAFNHVMPPHLDGNKVDGKEYYAETYK